MSVRDTILRLLGAETAATAASQRLFSEDLYAIRPGASIGPRAEAEDEYGYQREPEEKRKPYRMVADGIAEVRIEGVLSKRPDLFRWLGLSCQQTLPEMAAAVRAATADADVKGIMLAVDSPGGSVFGTTEVAQAVAAARAAKPVHAYGRDECASAAYWIASQATRLTTNAVAHVGSVGVYCVLLDASALNAEIGLRFVAIKSGEFKGAGDARLELTDEQIAYFQAQIEDVNAQFLGSVSAGRGLSAKEVKALADGRCYVGEKAIAVGLSDGVGTYQDALAALIAEVGAAETRSPAEPQPEDVPPEDEDESPEEPAANGGSMSQNDTKPDPTGQADEERSFVRRLMGMLKGEPEAKAETPPAQAVGLTAEQVDARIAAARHEDAVDRDLGLLVGKVPPAVLANPETRAMLIEAKAKGPEAYKARLGILGASDASALLGGPLASADQTTAGRTGLSVSATDLAYLEAHGCSAETVAKLEARFGPLGKPIINSAAH